MKVRQVYVTARDPDALAEFYKRALGIEVRFADPGKWIQFQMDGAAFCVAGRTESAVSEAQNAVPVFDVDQLDAFQQHLAAAGGELLSGVRDMGEHGRVLSVRDPEGNVFQLFQRRA